MEGEEFFGTAYKGSKQFSQQDVKTANATGFGAAADDYMERGIDLNEQLVKNKPSTYFFRMKGDAMRDAGIFDNDVLIVDRSLKLAEGKIIVAVLNGELLVRRFHKNFSAAFLIPRK
jgi:DNA polymerase V